MRDVTAPTPDDVAAAWDVVRPVVRRTPVVDLDGLAVKAELLQHTGSFKVRGALAALAALPDDAEVVTASAGNHGLGVAWAAARTGRRASVVVPEGASQAKVARLRTFPVRLVEHGAGYDEAEAHALALADAGAVFVSPYNDRQVMAGAGTVAVELREQVPDLARVVVPVGGGGLVSGVATWLAAHAPQVEVVGVEPATTATMAAAMANGARVDPDAHNGPTVADGLAGGLEEGSATVGVVAAHVARLVTVTEEEISDAMRHLHAGGLVAEGAGAVAVAAVRTGRVPAEEGTVALCCGRNVARSVLVDLLR